MTKHSSKLPFTVARWALVLAAVPIAAQDNASAQIEPSAIVLQACSVASKEREWNGHRPIPGEQVKDAKPGDKDYEWVAIDPRRLLFFAIAGSGETTSVVDAERRADQAFSTYRLNQVHLEKDHPDFLIYSSIKAIQDDLRGSALDGLKTFDSEGQVATLWQPEDSLNRSIGNFQGTVRCKVKKKPVAVDISPGPVAPPLKTKWAPDFNLRGTVDALFLTGKERKSASAAEIAVERVRAFQDDGSRKEVTTLTSKAVLGLMLLPPGKEKSLAAYVGYELNRPRTKPFVAPVPPATVRDGDTELLKFGLIGSQYIDLTPGVGADTAMVVSVDTAYLFDLAHDAERFRGRFIVSPYQYVRPGGVCGIRYFAPTFVNGVRAKCAFDFTMQQNVVTKDGSLKAKLARDSWLIGGKFTYDVMLTGDLDAGVIAGGSIDYQRRVHGSVPHVRQHRLFLKYRIWQGELAGFEFGPELVDGINPESFEDENKVVLKAGIIF